MSTNAALESLLDGLNAALREHIRPATGLFDPLDDKPTPPDHYGQVCAALALACAGERDWAIGRQALEAWLALDERKLGHLPFNRLALLLLRSVLGARGLAAADAALIDAGLRRCRLRRRYPSNNWSLLAQTCRLLEASAARKPRESRRLCALLTRWTTPKGGFIDFPENPGRRFCTPLAYHHKALFLTALACCFHDDAALAGHARRLCDWLVHCWDPAGYAGGFGRSTHSLFGDGCLIAGLILHGIEDDPADQPITALARRLHTQRRPDGFLWLNPAGHESGKASWDSYMHLSVYNAWAAALIGVARHLHRARGPSAAPNRCAWRAPAAGWFHDAEAGLACARTSSGLTAVLSTHGQPPQAYSRDEADFRYAGGVILHLCERRRGPLLAPPVRVPRRQLEQHPELAGWTPLFSVGGEIHALSEFECVAAELQDHHIRLKLEGQARPLFRPPPSSVWQRLAAALDWRLLGGRLGRKAVLRQAPSGLKGKLLLTLSTAADPVIDIALEIVTSPGVDAIYLNPRGTAWASIGGGDGDATSTRAPSSLPGAHVRRSPPVPLPAGFSRWTLSGRITGTRQRTERDANHAP